jgi:ubiquitin C-terminal hydrolase
MTQAGVVSASKAVKLQTLPKVLILHLMRFSFGSAGSGKLHKPVTFSPEIVLSRELLVSPTTEVIIFGIDLYMFHFSFYSFFIINIFLNCFGRIPMYQEIFVKLPAGSEI